MRDSPFNRFMNHIEEEFNLIDNDTNYWLVRTMGGNFYEEFVEKGYIAIGYNEITVDDLLHLPQKEKMAKKVLQAMIKDRKNNLKNTGYPVGQLMRFSKGMKKGDIIIVPSSASHKLSFGVIEGDMYEDTHNIHAAYGCPFTKRRNVKWIRTADRYKLPAELQLMFNSRHIISEVNNYSEHIDSFLNDFYTKDGMTYLVLRVKQQDALSADDFTLVADLMQLFNDYSNEFALGITSKDIKMKISVQSPGDILAYATSPEGIAVLGLFIMFIKGGTFNIDFKEFHMSIQTPTVGGMFSKIGRTVTEFLNEREKRKTIEALRNKLNNMDIETPGAILEIMDKLAGGNDEPKELE